MSCIYTLDCFPNVFPHSFAYLLNMRVALPFEYSSSLMDTQRFPGPEPERVALFWLPSAYVRLVLNYRPANPLAQSDDVTISFDP